MAVNFFVNVFDGTHAAILNTLDHRPAVVFGSGLSGTAAGCQIFHILLVNVRMGVGISLTAAHHVNHAKNKQRIYEPGPVIAAKTIVFFIARRNISSSSNNLM